MSSTTFSSGTTIASSWLNDVNNAVYNNAFPNSPGGTTKFLRADGTWSVPSGGGSGTYPSAGIANSTGSAWGTSYSTSGSGTVIPLATGATLVTPTISSTFTWGTTTMSAPTGGATAYLNANGGWTTPSGTGTPNLNAVLTAGNTSTLNASFNGVGIGNQVTAGVTVYGITSASNYVGLQNNFGGGTTYSALLAGSAFIPYPDNAIDLGASPYRWKSLGVNGTFYWGNTTITAPDTSSGLATKYLNQQGGWSVPSGTGSGLTSVGISVPTGMSVTGSPLTANGTIALGWSGQIPVGNLGTGTANTTSFLRGDGTWSNTFTSNATIGGVGIGNQINAPTGLTVYGITSTANYVGMQSNYGGASPYTVLLSGAAFIPYPDNTLALGGGSYRWASLALGTGPFAWNGYTIAAPSGSTSTYLRNDGTWASVTASTPNLQAVCTVGSTYTGGITTTTSSTFNGVGVGQAVGSGYYGITTSGSTIGFQNNFGGSTNTILLQNANLVPISSNAIGLGTSALPFGSLAVSGNAFFGTSSSWSQTVTVYATCAGSAVGLGAYCSGTSGNATAAVVASTTSNLAYFGYGSPSSPSTVGTISTNGTGVTYGTASDRRLKTSIANYTNSGSFIDSLKPRTFTWLSTNAVGIGFIADELQVVCRDAVNGEPNAVDDKGRAVYQSVDTSTPEMIANIVAELQSLRARLKAANL